MADASQEPLDPAAALAAMRTSQAAILKRNECPPWRHALFAGLLSSVVAAQAAPEPVFFGYIACVMLAVIGIVAVERARNGMFINGWRPGATRGVAVGIFGVYLAIYSLTWWLKLDRGRWVAPLIGGAVLFPMAWYASRRWMQVYRRELQA